MISLKGGLKCSHIGAAMLLLTSSAWAKGNPAPVIDVSGSTNPPPCLSSRVELPLMNDKVISWKTSTANQFLARARVKGPITKLYPDRNGHTHFEIDLGTAANDTLEVVYNQEFGALPQLKTGMQVEACGDYITSIAQSGAYPPSPDGAIIHWVHRNPNGKGHESGYLMIDGSLYGMGSGRGH